MGRPTLLTPDTAARIVRNLSSGAFIDEAAGAAGIAESTIYKWLARGRATLQSLGENETPDPDDAPYVELVEATTRARFEARVQAHATLRAHFARAEDKGDWRAAEAYLKLVDPRRYRNRIEVTGAEGGAVEMNLAVSARQQIAERLGEMRLRVLPSPEDAEVIDLPDDSAGEASG